MRGTHLYKLNVFCLFVFPKERGRRRRFSLDILYGQLVGHVYSKHRDSLGQFIGINLMFVDMTLEVQEALKRNRS